MLKAYGDENWDFPDPRCKSSFKIRLSGSELATDHYEKDFNSELINREIKEIISYNDSVDAVITTYRDSIYISLFES